MKNIEIKVLTWNMFQQKNTRPLGHPLKSFPLQLYSSASGHKIESENAGDKRRNETPTFNVSSAKAGRPKFCVAGSEHWNTMEHCGTLWNSVEQKGNPKTMKGE